MDRGVMEGYEGLVKDFEKQSERLMRALMWLEIMKKIENVLMDIEWEKEGSDSSG